MARSQGAIQNNTKDKQSNKQIPKQPTSGPRSERQPADGPRADSQGNSYGNESIAHKRPISEIIQRKDNQEMNLKALEVNRLFADICRSRDWSLISHTNIAEGSLDRSGLHLNPQGTALLASNFVNHIKHF